MNNELLINMGINVVLTLLKDSIKNAKKKAQYRKAILKIYNNIKLVFADDPDFA